MFKKYSSFIIQAKEEMYIIFLVLNVFELMID